MQNLSEIASEIGAAAGKLWPDVSASPDVRPLADLNLGDITSGACFQIAAQSGLDVIAVTEELAAELNRNSSRNWQAAFGFINGSFRDPIALAGVESLPPIPSRAIVGIPAPPAESDDWAFARLAAVAAMQWRLLVKTGVKVEFLIGNKLVEMAAATWPQYLLAAISECVGAEFSVEILLKSDMESIYCWLRTQSVSTAVFQRALNDPRITIHELTAPQGISPEADLNLKEWLRLYGSQAGKLLVYLAQGSSGMDLYPELSMRETTDNLCWLIESLEVRLNLPEYSVSRCLMHRLRYLPVFERRAAVLGEVFDFMTAARDTLTELRNSCNGASPESQYRLSKNELLAGLERLKFLQFP